MNRPALYSIPTSTTNYRIHLLNRLPLELDEDISLYQKEEKFYIKEVFLSEASNFLRVTNNGLRYNHQLEVEESAPFIQVVPIHLYDLDEVAQIWEGSDLQWSNSNWKVDDNYKVTRLIPNPTPTTTTIPYQRYSSPQVSNNSISNFIESLPKLVQFLNLLDHAEYRDIEEAGKLGMYKAEVLALAIIKSKTVEKLKEIQSSTCFPIPKLDTYEAEVTITGVSEATISFTYRGGRSIGINTPIQLEVNFYSTMFYRNLEVEQSDRYYNPTHITYRVSKYSSSTGYGTAQLETNQRLMLRDDTGILYKYYTLDIGKKIFPLVISSYLVI